MVPHGVEGRKDKHGKPRAYVRLHSRNADAWYRGDKQRYDYNYSDAELGDWVAAVEAQEVLGGTERALFLFNNCHRSQAPRNAGPGFTVTYNN